MPLSERYSDKNVLIEIDELNNFLQITWLQHPSSESFRHIMTLAAQYALKKQLTLWLCDMRKLWYLLLIDQNWLVQEVYAGLQRNQHYKIAYVVSNEDLELFSSFRIQNLVEADFHLRKILQIEIYFEKHQALEWLQDQPENIRRNK